MYKIISQLEDMTRNHVDMLSDKGVDSIIVKMGSFLSILSNKKTNHIKLFQTILNDKLYRECFMGITEFESFEELVKYMAKKYPPICKSKIIYKDIKKYDNKD